MGYSVLPQEGFRYHFIMKNGEEHEGLLLSTYYGSYNYEMFEVVVSDGPNLHLREDTIQNILPLHVSLPKHQHSKVITLCGSTRFKKEFEEINAKLTLEGNVVISVGIFVHQTEISISEEQKELLDRIHLQKIDMADEVFIVNVDGYIGSSTKKEIEYALKKGKPVHYLSN